MINRYFDSSIHILIDEMDMIMKDLSNIDQQEYANKKYSEADFTIRLGSPFRQWARYPMHGTKGHDIIIDYKDFKVEIKYWRNWHGGTGTQKAVWANSYGDDFNWLVREIKNGKKNLRALVCGWFTFFEWRELLQLGSSPGPNPFVNKARLKKLPFLSCRDGYIRSLRTEYSTKCGTIEESDYMINWELHGDATNKFNILMLY